MDNFKNILFIFPVMLYYLLEAIIVGLFITVIWRLILSNTLGAITYFQWVSIYWIAKMLFFDVFKLIAGLSTMGKNLQKKIEEE